MKNTVIATILGVAATLVAATGAQAGQTQTYLRTKVDANVRDSGRADSLIITERIGVQKNNFWAEIGAGGSLSGNDEAVIVGEFGVQKALTNKLHSSLIVEPMFFSESGNVDVKIEGNLLIPLN